MRSLEPILKNSTSAAKMSGIVAAAGVSIMHPKSTWPSKSTPSACRPCLTSLTTRIVSWNSVRLVISGNMIAHGPMAQASESARIWTANCSRCSRSTRIPRQPSMGLASGSGRYPGHLIRPQVKGAKGDAMREHGFDDTGVEPVLLFFAGGLTLGEKKILRPQQSNTLRSLGQGVRYFFGQTDVGGEQHPPAIERFGRRLPAARPTRPGNDGRFPGEWSIRAAPTPWD